MPSRRTLFSIIRTVVYAGLTAGLALWHGEVKGLADAVLVGAICGDYVTWLIWSVIELPENLVHGCYETCLNLLFGLLIYRLGNIHLGAQMDAELSAVMFLAFLFVSGVKVLCLSVVFVEEEIEDDD